MSTFADQAAIAIENVRLFDEIQDKNRLLQQAITQRLFASMVFGGGLSMPAAPRLWRAAPALTPAGQRLRTIEQVAAKATKRSASA